MITRTEIAFVTNVADPGKRGCIKVICPNLLNTDYEIPDWIEPDRWGRGESDPPEVGEMVFIEYDDSDPISDLHDNETFMMAPNYRWRPYVPTGPGGRQAIPSPLLENYPNRRGKVSRRGHWFFWDDDKDQQKQFVTLGHRCGSELRLYGDGAIKLRSSSGATLFMGPDGSVNGDGSYSALARYDELKAHLEDLAVKFNQHVHATPAGASSTTVTVFPSPPTSMASKVKGN